MGKKFLLYTLLFGTIHFCLSILSIIKGFYLFGEPSGAMGIFWTNAMDVLLFPASIVIQGSGSQWKQTVTVVLNSFAWGAVFADLYLGLRKVR